MTTASKPTHKGGGAVLVGYVGEHLLVRWCVPRALIAWLLDPAREDNDVASISCDSIRVEISAHADDATAKRVAAETVEKLALAVAQTRGAA